MMRKTPLAAGLAAVLAAALGGCIVNPAPVSYDTPQPADSPPQTYEPTEQASEPPPPLPVYEQPPCPEEGWVWTPGVWRWGPEGYFWVPGTWVAPPSPGVYWTPGYWAFSGTVYLFHPGYWGRHVGYYGGINYGGGYTGSGFVGGRWNGDRYQYNTAVTNVNIVNVHNTYNQTVVNNVIVRNPGVTRPSFAGAAPAPGVRPVMPSRSETAYAREPRVMPTPPQMQHRDMAQSNPQQNAARNQGRPPVAATPRPATFNGGGVTAAKPVGPVYHPVQQHGPPARQEGRPDRPDRPNPNQRPN
ncbi:MAG TPA: hypothetical protein VET66_02025 [Steroidobacteraceae bacterium]|nr:hypothetical protein [Steroidobacteraceae bacterium]